MDLRVFTYGIIAGIFIVLGSFVVASWLMGIKWQPVVATLPH